MMTLGPPFGQGENPSLRNEQTIIAGRIRRELYSNQKVELVWLQTRA